MKQPHFPSAAGNITRSLPRTIAVLSLVPLLMLVTGILSPGAAAAQQMQPAAANTPTTTPARAYHLIATDVMVVDKAGKPVSGLKESDFTLTDNGQPSPLLSFHAYAHATDNPPAVAEVDIVIDTINTPVHNVGFIRDQIVTFLRHDGGKLAHPVAIWVLSDDGVKRLLGPSIDGEAIAKSLQDEPSTLRPTFHGQTYYGAIERVQLSLNGLGQFAAMKAHEPGRKLLLWLGPSWPILPGTESWITRGQATSLFDTIVTTSTILREARIVLDAVDPVETSGNQSLEWFYYKTFLDGISDPMKATLGNLAVQVLSAQSGGQVTSDTSRYLSDVLGQLVANSSVDYFMAIKVPAAAKKDEYHALKITVDRPDLTVYTRAGYYNEP